jgi:hypothetical protein
MSTHLLVVLLKFDKHRRRLEIKIGLSIQFFCGFPVSHRLNFSDVCGPGLFAMDTTDSAAKVLFASSG